MKIKEVLEQAIIKLKENNIEEPINKARRILAFALNVDKQYLIINDRKELDKTCIEKYNAYIKRLILGEPIQYIIEKQEFMGIDFFVNKNVLIPQPDTEILVEKSIEILKEYNKPIVLDLCTGSGAIAVSIAKNIPNAEIYASDISIEALEIAKINDIDGRINFLKSDLFENIEKKFDLIISNPPYIKTDEINLLSKEVQNEPHLALDGGQDGLYFYKRIITEAYKFLNENGYLCLEIGEDQKDDVINIIKQSGKYENIESYKDLGGNDRIVVTKTCNVM